MIVRALVSSSATALLLSAAPAFAQDPGQPAEPVAAEADALDDIVVTAQRRSESLLEVPISVAVVEGDALRSFQSGGEDILALSGRVPGLYAETTTGRIFPRFYIRGLGNIDFYLGASQPVSIIQDEVVLEHVVLKSNPVYDVRQIEVLRGPQGSLFGRNTTAGIIKFDTIRPGDTFSGRASASYGSYNTVTFDGGVGGPVIQDKLAVRVSGLWQHRDDWVDNVFTGTSADGTVAPRRNVMGGFDDRNFRVQALATPTENFSALAAFRYRDYEGTSTLFRRETLTRGSNELNARYDRDRVSYDEAQNNDQAYESWGSSLNMTYDFGGITLTSITAYETANGFSRGDTDGGAAADFPVNGVPNGFGQSRGNLRDLDQWSQEVRLASDGTGPFGWQIGGLYFDSRDTTDFYQRAFFLTTAARNPNNWVRLRNVNTSWAGFGQINYEVLPDLTITAGGRVTNDTKRTRLLKTADTAAGVVTYRGRRDVRLSDTQFSWDLSALYQVNPDFSVYSRIARGFRGPTIQGRSAVFNADFTTADSETILSVETGFKGAVMNNRLRFGASIFAYRVDDIQLNGNDANGNGVLFNANQAKAYGAEAEFTWIPSDRFTLSGGLSLLHSEINDRRVFAQVCALNGQVVCTVKDPTRVIATPFGPGVFAQIDGNPLPNAPEYNANIAARYNVPVGAGEVFIATDWNIQGFTSFVLYETEEFNANGNFEGGLQIGYANRDVGYEVALFARNITNESNLKGVIENFNASVVNEPRIIGISLNASFD